MHQELKAEIERARQMLPLDDDWDGEGSPGYSEETLNRAIAFLTEEADGLWDLRGICLPVPRIGPGPDGSIDLHWKLPTRELLVNIPADAGKIATFYGDHYSPERISGSLDSKNFHFEIAVWLVDDFSGHT